MPVQKCSFMSVCACSEHVRNMFLNACVYLFLIFFYVLDI